MTSIARVRGKRHVGVDPSRVEGGASRGAGQSASAPGRATRSRRSGERNPMSAFESQAPQQDTALTTRAPYSAEAPCSWRVRCAGRSNSARDCRRRAYEVEPADMAAQYPLTPVLDHRVEDAPAREQLARVLLDPQP